MKWKVGEKRPGAALTLGESFYQGSDDGWAISTRTGRKKTARSTSIRGSCLYRRAWPCLGFLVLSALTIWNANAQSAETFVLTGSMTTPRRSHTATLLKDGRV